MQLHDCQLVAFIAEVFCKFALWLLLRSLIVDCVCDAHDQVKLCVVNIDGIANKVYD